MVHVERVVRAGEADEIRGDADRALMDQLIIRVLTIRAGSAPYDRAGLHADGRAVAIDGLAVALHVELLQIRRELPELVAVRQYDMGLRAQEVAVPDADQAEQYWQILGERCGPEMLVHRVEARKHRPEVVGADRNHQREADGRIERIAAADPVPEPEHVGSVDAKFGDLLRVGRDGDEVVGHSFLAERVDQPCAGRAGIGERLDGREGLGADDEHRLGRLEPGDSTPEICPIDVRHESARQAGLAVRSEGVVGHGRSEIGPADADVDDRPNGSAGCSLPGAVSDPVGERGHLVEDVVHLVDHVDTVDHKRCTARCTQRRVQDSAILGDVDMCTDEHGVDLCA